MSELVCVHGLVCDILYYDESYIKVIKCTRKYCRNLADNVSKHIC